MSDATTFPPVPPAPPPTAGQIVLAFFKFVNDNKTSILAMAAFAGMVYHTFITSATVNDNKAAIQKIKDDVYSAPIKPQPPDVPAPVSKPDEKAKPAPVPAPGKIAAHVSFVTAEPDPTPEMLAVGKWLADLGVNSYHVSMNDKDGAAEAVRSAVRSGAGPPAIVQQDAQGNIIDIARWTTAEAAKKLLK